MRVRVFGLLLLLAVGIVPLAVFSYLALGRSERTAEAEVRTGNERVAKSIAQRISAYREAERALLLSIGAAVLQADVEDAQAILEAYAIDHRHFHELVVVDEKGGVRASVGGATAERLAQRAVTEGAIDSEVQPADPDSVGAFAHTQWLGVPVDVVGARVGAIASRVDLVDVWKPVNAIKVGRHGFVRLITFDGILLAHGDPEERRHVFAGDESGDAPLVAAAMLGRVGETREGVEALAGVAFVPDQSWMVVVEQPIAEAFAATVAMKRDLVWLGGGAVIVAVVLGLGLGGRVVRSLESLRAHTRVLAEGKLDARIEPKAPLLELAALARSLNEMAASIQKLHDEARARERLSTFARVAAGLAHDLRLPIETVRAACSDLLRAPQDEDAQETFEWMTARELPKLQRFVDDLRRIAQEGNVDLRYGQVDPRALVDELVADLSANPKWGGVEFSAEGSARALMADENLIRRAVYNLAANAADACVGSGPGGKVWLAVEDHGDAGVDITVRDTGGGIEARKLADLLVGDFRSTKRSSGVGLGFGVARHVAQAHGGEITAESEVGVGSAFTLHLPRDDRAAAAARVSQVSSLTH